MTKIDLRDDGITSEVTLLSGKVETYKTSDFQLSQQSELKGNFERFGMMGFELFPMRIGNRQLMIDKRGRIEQPEVFKALCNGY